MGRIILYAVSAVNTGGERANLLPVSAIPVSLTQPQLTFSINGNQFHFNWPADHLGWKLQAQTNAGNVGLNTNWVTVAGSTATNKMYVSIGSTNGSVFFRITYP
jgi:hypothetical protein